jgi:hypothetical protein
MDNDDGFPFVRFYLDEGVFCPFIIHLLQYSRFL